MPPHADVLQWEHLPFPKSLRDGRLIVKPYESDRSPFALIVRNSDDESWRVAGWIYGSDAKQRFPLNRAHGDPAHYVPQSALRPPADLLDVIHEQRLERLGVSWVRPPF